MKRQEKMEYAELVTMAKENELKSEFNVVCYLVGYKGFVDSTDLENIRRLFYEEAGL